MKGQPKENAREKKERKKEFRENKDKVWTVALPTFGVIFLLIAVSVYLSTRPKSVIEGWRKAIFMEYGFSGRGMSLIEPCPCPRSPGFRSEKPEFSWTAVSISFSFCSPFNVITKFKRVYQTEIKKTPISNQWSKEYLVAHQSSKILSHTSWVELSSKVSESGLWPCQLLVWSSY